MPDAAPAPAVRVADLADALRGLDPDLALGEERLCIAMQLPDGRWQHIRLEAGVLRVQAEPRRPDGVPPGEFCGPCPHFSQGSPPSCLLLDQSFWENGPSAVQDKLCGLEMEAVGRSELATVEEAA